MCRGAALFIIEVMPVAHPEPTGRPPTMYLNDPRLLAIFMQERRDRLEHEAIVRRTRRQARRDRRA
jgi:hypothetical protein